jgi:lycopene beta-cyclase
MGGTIHRVHAAERCRIPLDGGWPKFRLGVVPIGGAASMVHPATGYQLSRGLAAAAALAAAVDIDLPCADLTTTAWAAVLPGSSWATRALHLYGLGVVLGLDAAGTREHFDAFFSSGDSAWRTMLADDADPGRTARVMLRMAALSPWSVRRTLPSLSALSRALATHAVASPTHGEAPHP